MGNQGGSAGLCTAHDVVENEALGLAFLQIFDRRWWKHACGETKSVADGIVTPALKK